MNVFERKKKYPTVLYISYTGVLEPLGQSQVLSYLTKLARKYRIILLSYEKRSDWENEHLRGRIESELKRADIRWVPLTYHQHPRTAATAFDILRGLTTGISLSIAENISVVHARSYLAAIMGYPIAKIAKARLLFDMRGFWVDERVSAGSVERDSALYRAAKRVECLLLRKADAIVSLTEAAVAALETMDCGKIRNKTTVIPTCVDLGRFRRSDDGKGPFRLGCVGTVGGWFNLDAVLSAFTILLELRPRAEITFINRGEHELIWNRVKDWGLPLHTVSVKAVEHAEVPEQLQSMDAGVFFYHPNPSELARAPTKMAEFLASGVPCLANAGVGDVGRILVEERVGAVVERFDPEDLRAGVVELVSLTEDRSIGDRCRAAAEHRFSLDVGVEAYGNIYDRLIGHANCLGTSPVRTGD